MKKWMTLLLAAAMLLGLAACGAGAPEGDAPSESGLRFAAATSVYENEYKANDGTLLLSERYELPRLELRTADGALYTAAENLTANTASSGAAAAQVMAQSVFNNEMDSVLAGLKAEAAEMAAEAKKLYASDGDDSLFALGGHWASELAVGSVYQTGGGLVSVRAEGYTYYGGSHPNGSTRAWNFDLTTGGFLTADDLAEQNGAYSDYPFRRAIYWGMLDEIEAKGLAEGYFDDYDSYLWDFSSFAAINFTADGLTVTFDPYIIAPYAAGAQIFEIPYEKFFYTLDRHTQALFDMPQEKIVEADYHVTQSMWTWFHMTTPPIDESMPSIEDENGHTYYHFGIKGVDTMEQLRALLEEHVTGEVVDEWLAYSPDRFKEVDGRLYVLSADRGGDDSYGSQSLSVDLESGVLTQTVERLDYTDDGYVPNGEEVFEYPFTLVDGHAVFSAFPCPY